MKRYSQLSEGRAVSEGPSEYCTILSRPRQFRTQNTASLILSNLIEKKLSLNEVKADSRSLEFGWQGALANAQGALFVYTYVKYMKILLYGRCRAGETSSAPPLSSIWNSHEIANSNRSGGKGVDGGRHLTQWVGHQLMSIRVYSSSGEGSQERGFAECLI